MRYAATAAAAVSRASINVISTKSNKRIPHASKCWWCQTSKIHSLNQLKSAENPHELWGHQQQRILGRCRGWWNSTRSALRRQLSGFAMSSIRQRQCFDGPYGSCCCSPEQLSQRMRLQIEPGTTFRIQRTSTYRLNTCRRCAFRPSLSATRTLLHCRERRLSVSCHSLLLWIPYSTLF